MKHASEQYDADNWLAAQIILAAPALYDPDGFMARVACRTIERIGEQCEKERERKQMRLA